MADPIQILIVDDDPDIRLTVARILERNGISSKEAGNGEEMRRQILKEMPDLVILDLMLPGDDGLTLARELRGNSDIPIIMLTGKGDVVDRIVGLEMGADDYVTKPFNSRELLARVKSVLRRRRRPPKTSAPEDTPKLLEFNGWTLNLDSQRLISPDGEPVALTTYEFQVLSVLAQRPNRGLSRSQILDLVADREWDPYDRSIDVLIVKIRRKLNDDPKSPTCIKTLRNFGYMFIGETTAPSDS